MFIGNERLNNPNPSPERSGNRMVNLDASDNLVIDELAKRKMEKNSYRKG